MKERVIRRLLAAAACRISLATILQMAFEAGEDHGGYEAAGWGKNDLLERFDEKMQTLLKGTALSNAPSS